MPSTAERIVAELARAGSGLTDAELASALDLRHQAINQACRVLERQGRLRRVQAVGFPIRNLLIDPATAPAPPSPRARAGDVTPLLSEDEVKAAVRDHLEAMGYSVTVAWGRAQGVDIEARGPDGRLLLEAKGAAANPPQQVNYFLGALGELIQRASDPDARYGLALPDNHQYRGLVARLPALARTRLRLVVYFIARDPAGYVVTVDDSSS
jgi:hypothetical protein